MRGAWPGLGRRESPELGRDRDRACRGAA